MLKSPVPFAFDIDNSTSIQNEPSTINTTTNSVTIPGNTVRESSSVFNRFHQPTILDIDSFINDGIDQYLREWDFEDQDHINNNGNVPYWYSRIYIDPSSNLTFQEEICEKLEFDFYHTPGYMNEIRRQDWAKFGKNWNK
ncbi:hypothetical protein KKF91_12850 [Myxococcota bacterium]|nr:hypothetical protein [Myxococcota bacterium]MBU1431423.1 hypothetical protein [Myxococcota bacterium]